MIDMNIGLPHTHTRTHTLFLSQPLICLWTTDDRG